MGRKNTRLEEHGFAMSPPIPREERQGPATPLHRGRWLPVAAILGLIAFTPAFAGTAPSMKVDIPDTPHQGKPIKVRVTFSAPPPRGDFFRLEADVDKSPVALSDLSEESSIWVTLPPQTAGSHTFSVIWRNFPGKNPLVRSKILKVLP